MINESAESASGELGMKWVYLLGVVMLAPLLMALLHGNRRYLVPTCFVLGFSMLMVGPSLWAALIGWPVWPAPVKGLEISFVDAISLALIVSTPRVRIPRSIKLSFLIVCLALIVSTAVAYNRMAAFFYIWMLLRTALLFVAVARVSAYEPRAPIAIMSGLSLALVGELIWVLVQSGQGVPRPGGSLGHSNVMGIAGDMVIFPALALVLARRRMVLPALAVIAGGACAVFGGSRASMGLFAVGVPLTVLLSIIQKSTSRKFALASLMGILVLASIPAMIWSDNRRTAQAKASSDFERGAMKDAAKMIIADHPLGVGANQYVIVANVGGYSARAGVAWNWATRNAPVHDTYYLVTAETGVLGLIGLLAVFASTIATGLMALRRRLPGQAAELLPGLVAALIIVAAHISYEFAFMEFILHYLFATCAGILVAISSEAKAPSRVMTSAETRHSQLSTAS